MPNKEKNRRYIITQQNCLGKIRRSKVARNESSDHLKTLSEEADATSIRRTFRGLTERRAKVVAKSDVLVCDSNDIQRWPLRLPDGHEMKTWFACRLVSPFSIWKI